MSTSSVQQPLLEGSSTWRGAGGRGGKSNLGTLQRLPNSTAIVDVREGEAAAMTSPATIAAVARLQSNGISTADGETLAAVANPIPSKSVNSESRCVTNGHSTEAATPSAVGKITERGLQSAKLTTAEFSPPNEGVNTAVRYRSTAVDAAATMAAGVRHVARAAVAVATPLPAVPQQQQDWDGSAGASANSAWVRLAKLYASATLQQQQVSAAYMVDPVSPFTVSFLRAVHLSF